MGLPGKAFRLFASGPSRWRARRVPPRCVLVLGVYLADKPNLAPEIALALGQSKHRVTQRWASVGTGSHRVAEMSALTAATYETPTPKFQIINTLLASEQLSAYDHVIVADDDIELPPWFMDDYIGLQEVFGFALAQPARSLQSNVDHLVTLERHSCIARQTGFVEIGPLFSMAARAFPLLLPFDESFYMGWGLDHVWPVMLRDAGLTQGIIDITPVHHRMRPVATTYSGDVARKRMSEALQGRECIDAVAKLQPLRLYRW